MAQDLELASPEGIEAEVSLQRLVQVRRGGVVGQERLRSRMATSLPVEPEHDRLAPTDTH